MVGVVSAQTAAARKDSAIRQQQRNRMVIARNRRIGRGPPLAGRRVPDFRRENGTGVVEFEPGSVSANHHDFAVGQHDRIGELPREIH